MRDRCTNPKAERFALYGGRGIRVCDRWQTFDNFFADMGPKPSPRHSLDRIDNDGNYEPGNVRWATQAEQLRNTSRNVMLTFRGETMCAKDWAKKIGIAHETLRDRINAGWPLERALTTPALPKGAGKVKALLEHDGRRLSTAEWAREMGLSHGTITLRLRKGWPVAKALTTPGRKAG